MKFEVEITNFESGDGDFSEDEVGVARMIHSILESYIERSDSNGVVIVRILDGDLR